jgi:hypothetical protein
MGQVSTIGLDTAKRVFQVHGVDDADAVVLRRQLWRTEVLKFFAPRHAPSRGQANTERLHDRAHL